MTDCCNIEAKELISIEQALQTIEQSIAPVDKTEQVDLKNALGRVLSRPVSCPINIPSDKNSAMDGYAFASSDIKLGSVFSLSLVGTSWAGKPYKNTLKTTECVRIFTGAVVPDGADSVIMQESIEKKQNKVIFPANTTARQNIREVACDIKINTELLTAPKKLSATNIALLASAGIVEVPVYRKLNIAYFSTGDELKTLGKTLKPGQIYDSNRYALSGLLSNNNFISHDLGLIADDKKQLEETLLSAANTYDVIISTGGASVGDADYIKQVLEQCGSVTFWKIAIKPGKPLAFGKINNCYFFGLPGNPVAVFTTFHKIVFPGLQCLAGIPIKKVIQLNAICTSNLKKKAGRQEYQRGILSQNDSGELHVKSAGKQGSNIMSTMSSANCYIVLPIASKGVSVGESVLVEPFDFQG